MHPVFGLDDTSRRKWLAEASGAFPYVTWLESCGYNDSMAGDFEWIWAAACSRGTFTGNEWRFGIIPYPDQQKNKSLGQADLSAMFVPDVIAGRRRDGSLVQLGNLPVTTSRLFSSPPIPHLKPVWDEDTYIQKVSQIKEFIAEGDHYELNLCFPFEAEFRQQLSPTAFCQLCEYSPSPFAAFVRMPGKQAFCASPERFLSVRAGKCISQPIKGTAPRGLDFETDLYLVEELKNSPKEQAENVMIVDLTRHDMYGICVADTVTVPELFSVKTYPHVHQLVSTVTGTLLPGIRAEDALKHMFPPGSMTGAPKKRVRERILELEFGSRDWYSGSVGYITPEGNLDMNVVIRTLFQDTESGKLRYWVGSAITWEADPRKEYAECLLKASGWQRWCSPV